MKVYRNVRKAHYFFYEKNQNLQYQHEVLTQPKNDFKRRRL